LNENVYIPEKLKYVKVVVTVPKSRCLDCGKKIGKIDRMKLKMMEKTMSISTQAKQEFEELKGRCPTCLTLIFRARGQEAWSQAKQKIGDQSLPRKARRLLEKAGFIEKEGKK